MTNQSHREAPQGSGQVQRADTVARRSWHWYHALLVVGLVALGSAYYWLGREMLERSRFNRARLSFGKAARMRRTDLERYVLHLQKAAEAFHYDGSLHLELARQILAQARRQQALYTSSHRRAYLRRAIELLEKALEQNRRAFETYFDVEAYKQLAWTHMELHSLEKENGRDDKAEQHLREATDGFQRVVRLNPCDIESLERLAYIQSYVATLSERRQDWERLMEWAKRLLDEQHDNTNGFFFLGLAYDNLGAKDRAAMYYFRAMTYPSTMPRSKRMWNRAEIIAHLKNLGYVPGAPATP